MLDALADGCTWEQAAARVGVSAMTLYRWCAADPELAAAAQEARDEADDQVEAVTFANCMDPDPSHNTLRMFWLKSRRRSVYGEVQKIELEDARKAYDTGNPPDAM